MLTLPTVLLRHETRAGSHYDWMMSQPGDPGGKLWTVRLSEPTSVWQSLGVLMAEPLPPHRRAYLTYQGPISGERGRVVRIDAGEVRPLAWSEHRQVLEVAMRDFAGVVSITALTPKRMRIEIERRLAVGV